MKILVTGANGQLAKCLKDEEQILRLQSKFLDEVIYEDKNGLDITNGEKVTKYIESNNIDIVINCAAYTNVDKAETDYDTAVNVNAYGPAYIANALKNRGGFMVHISTDYVYDGLGAQHAYSEDIIQPNPCNVYGRTKAMGERMIATTECPHIILRTSWLYSEYGNNFPKTIIKKLDSGEELLKVVCDQMGTPTYAMDLAKFIWFVIEERRLNFSNTFSIYNFSDEGLCSWYSFACTIKYWYSKLIKPSNTMIYPCRSYEFPSIAKRPEFSMMSKEKVKVRFDFEIPYWITSFEKFINNIAILRQNEEK